MKNDTRDNANTGKNGNDAIKTNPKDQQNFGSEKNKEPQAIKQNSKR